MTTEYLSFKQAMQYIGFNSYDSLRKAIKDGLPVIQFNGSKRISKTAIDEFMKAHTVVAREK
ncbi:DNA-binding protein [Lactobacillus johnsonii]|uniref:DNA-binding protein n=1 Tax=Lactobacillus johnsonii TaxID=33959 RepID=UPI003F5109A5